MPRYGADYCNKLKNLGYFTQDLGSDFWIGLPYYPPKSVLLAAKILTIAGATILGLVSVAVALAAWGLISL